MKLNKKFGLALKVGVGSFIGLVAISVLTVCCTKQKDPEVEEILVDNGFLKNDSLVVIKSNDGKLTIKNSVTGKVAIKDIEIDWTASAGNDSLAVFCSKGKRGYYNVNTGEIVVPAQYRRAWVFSEGLAGVQKDGMVGFIDPKGNTVIPFNFPYYGNPLTDYTFNNGRCVAANNKGKCGVIDNKGNWIIEPIYDDVNAYDEYAIVSKAGVRRQVAYNGDEINSFVLDDIKRLTYTKQIVYVNNKGDRERFTDEIDTGLFSYRISGRYGLMTADCVRLTEPLYSDIRAIDKNMFRATLLDYYSEVILNAKGEVMK